MKYILPIIVLFLFALGACEEIVYREIPGKTDTVTKFVDRVFAGLDSTKIPVTVSVPVPTRVQDSVISLHDTTYITRIDTLWVEKIVYVTRVDSIFVVKTIIQTDTIVQRIYEWGDTLFRYGIFNTYSVPTEMIEMVTQFYLDAQSHGLVPNGGEFILRIEKMDEVLQAYSYDFYGQEVIVINDNLTFNERMIPLWREMARWTLKKEYSQDPTKLMYPFHNVNLIRWDNRAQHKEDLTEFFQ